jgi:hypothetical protein
LIELRRKGNQFSSRLIFRSENEQKNELPMKTPMDKAIINKKKRKHVGHRKSGCKKESMEYINFKNKLL